MKELICPNCGKAFTVDDMAYADIVNQVKNAEFEKELERRMEENDARKKAELESAVLAAQQVLREQMQIKLAELADKMQAKQDELSKKEADILRLQGQIDNSKAVKDAELAQAMTAKDTEIATLKAELDRKNADTQVKVLEEQNKIKDILSQKDLEIAGLKNEVKAVADAADLEKNAQKESYEFKLKQKDEMIAYYKDFRNQSVKAIGEALEQYCANEFNKLRPLFPHAYFEKDNEVKDGTKGDFIYRNSEDGVEYISIMFEMKNENDCSVNKHKNEDFLKKLDEDRRKKGCEFAVLVSTLEPDSELYNTGIVDMSYRYPKMYVIRPQFFVPIITLLTQIAQGSLEIRKDLEYAKAQHIDVTHFEEKLEAFKKGFNYNCQLAVKNFLTAIENIDKSIKSLGKVKEDLLNVNKNLGLATNKLDDVTVKRLTYNNPTMKERFAEARASKNSETED